MNAWRGLAAGLVVLTAAGGLRADSRSEVRDEAGLFRPEVVTQVDRELKLIAQVYDRDVVIETIKELPDVQRQQLDRVRNNREAARLFAAWTAEKARAQHLNGVYVLISAIPDYKHVQVTAWPDTDLPTLRKRDCLALWLSYTQNLKHHGANQALIKMVEELHDCLDQNLSANQVTAAPLTWWALGLFGTATLMLWGLAEVGRGKRAAPGQAVSSWDGFGQDRALPGMMGEMFGSLAAQPIYDRALLDQARSEAPVPGPALVSPIPVELREETPDSSDNEQEQPQEQQV